MSERWRVKLPADVEGDFEVYVNGVRQQEGVDYDVSRRALLFSRRLVKAERLGVGRWLIGAFGIGTYRQDDSVDVRYSVNGRPRVAQGLEITPPPPR
ncbi:MAG: hypothetical protein ACR2HD_05990 [Solirubrobacteraceae bacterium]|nr:MAG: hypothetical protein DLM63_10950 [Solirubrobacterales bacterium]